MNLDKIFDLDPTVRRKIIYIAIWFFLLIAIALIPLVVQMVLFQNSGSAEQGFVIATVTLTNTSTISPSPGSQGFIRSGEAEAVATSLQKNCTNPTAYWLERQDSWPALISIGDFNYTKEQAITRIQTNTQSAWRDLFLNLHITLLNLLSGADQGDIKRTVLDAITWLSTYTENSAVPDLDLQIGLVLTQRLNDYNSGVIGPGVCEGISALPSGSRPTTTFTLPTGVNTLTATPASPTSGGVILPTYTRTPTERVQGPEPSATLPPPATATPPPPTSTPTQPRPTATQAPTSTLPLPTIIPTPILTPTSAPTPTEIS
ncbi:MAG TPA: hypothetical protein VJL34_00770 [Anaerolineales bacterium]|nr:hypothetical protein [Anaerolineales bacterium]